MASQEQKETRENVFPLLNRAGNLVTQDMEKAEVLKILSISVFTGKAFRPVGDQWDSLK